MIDASSKKRRIASIARRLYQTGPLLLKRLQHWRPYICPYEALIKCVPSGSYILDVGCGGGLLLGLLANMGRIAGGVGFDSNKVAIDLASSMTQNLPLDNNLKFLYLSATSAWPEGSFNVISMIDVVHHIPPKHQQQAIETAIVKVPPNGVLLYKDMADHPWYFAWANRLHDLVLARQWIDYLPVEQVISIARQHGLIVQHRETITMLWYRHELVVFSRPSKSSNAI